MKILLLNPHLQTSEANALALKQKGFVCLLASDPTEALQVLKMHGRSIELAIVHRESENNRGEPGIEFLSWFKQDPDQADLPCVLTSNVWSNTQFAAHQHSELGANAYLKAPYTTDALIKVIEEMFGSALYDHMPEATTSGIVAPGALSSGLVLEEASATYGRALESEGGSTIQLEGPGLDLITPDAPSAEFSTPEIALSPEELPIEVEVAPAIELAAPVELKIDTEATELSELPTAPSINPSQVSEPLQMDAPLVAAEVSPLAPDPHEPPADDAAIDQSAHDQMPYLFEETGHSIAPPAAMRPSPFEYVQPLGDAVVPGGAAHTPDLETLKKYLLLREQDVAALSAQLRSSREQVEELERALRESQGEAASQSHLITEQARKIENFEKEKAAEIETLHSEINELRFQARAKADRARALEVQVREAAAETERLKERVRSDIRKIRVREKELENRLEIIKKDSEALLSSRENKIVELKRKIDTLEFNLDLLQDQVSREKETSAQTRERLGRALQAVRVAGGLLDPSVNAEKTAS